MNKEKHDFFLHSNEVNHISKEDYDKIELLVNATKAFARSTYQCVYIIDYFHQDFIYASDNLAYLCGLEPEQLMEAGYQMPVVMNMMGTIGTIEISMSSLRFTMVVKRNGKQHRQVNQ